MASKKVFLLAEGMSSWNILSQHRWWHSDTALPKGQCRLETFFLDNTTLENIASASTEERKHKPVLPTWTNSVEWQALLEASWSTFQYRTSSSLLVWIVLPPSPSSPGAFPGTRSHHTRVWSTLSNSQDYFYCIHQLTQPDYSFCNHFSEIKERNLPTPLWASRLVNFIVPLWPFLGFSWYCLWFPLGQYL